MSWRGPLLLASGSIVALLFPQASGMGPNLLLATAAFLCWAITARWAPGSFSLRHLSLMGIFLTTYSVMITIPSFYIRLTQPDLGGAWFIPGVVAVYPFSCAAWFVTYRGLGLHPETSGEYFFAPTAIERGRWPPIAWGILVVTCFGLALTHITLSPVSPLMLLLDGASSGELARAREASLKTIPGFGIKYLFAWLMSVLFPLVSLWAFGRAMLERRRNWIIAATGVIALALLYATFTLAKAPGAMLVGMVLLVALLLRGKPVSTGQMVLGAALVLLIPATLVATISNAGPLEVTLAIARRLLYVPAEALVHYFEAFDTEHPFLGGRSISLFSRTVLGEPPFPVANFVYHLIHGEGLKTGLSNAAFVGSMWANFAGPGLLAGPTVVGSLIALSEASIVTGNKTLLKVCLHAILCLQVFFLSSRSVTIAMLTGGWVPALALVLSAGWLFNRLERNS